MKREVIRVEPLSTYLDSRRPHGTAIRFTVSFTVSGFPSFDPATGEVIDAPIARQADLVLERMKLCVETAGSSLEHVLKCNVYRALAWCATMACSIVVKRRNTIPQRNVGERVVHDCQRRHAQHLKLRYSLVACLQKGGRASPSIAETRYEITNSEAVVGYDREPIGSGRSGAWMSDCSRDRSHRPAPDYFIRRHAVRSAGPGRGLSRHLRKRGHVDFHAGEGNSRAATDAFESRCAASAILDQGRATIMTHTIHDIGVASQIGSYSDAIEAKPNLRWLVTSGTPGLAVGGDLPKDITGQAELAWQHVIGLLERAEMTVADIVKVTQYLTRADDIAAYAKVRSRFLGQVRPASMLLVIPQLVWPEILVEVEIMAAKA
jgi:2-iminobutanoate/2-iminopropanoate deaminase